MMIRSKFALLLFLIDPAHDVEDPTSSSWAGKFKKPCATWFNLKEMYSFNKSTLHKERAVMYESLLQKLDSLYK